MQELFYKIHKFQFISASSLSAFDMNSRTFIIKVSSIHDKMILGNIYEPGTISKAFTKFSFINQDGLS